MLWNMFVIVLIGVDKSAFFDLNGGCKHNKLITNLQFSIPNEQLSINFLYVRDLLSSETNQ